MNAGRGALIFAIAVAAALALLAPVGSYDFFWHLASGRWIVDHGALPLNDPFGLASERIEWINGSWLFQIIASAVWSAGGAALTVILRSLLALAGIAIVLRHASKRTGMATAAAITALAVYGAEHRLSYRPEGAATLLAVVAVAIAFGELSTWRRAALFSILTILWINVHPSALLAPLIYGAGVLSRWGASENRPPLREWMAIAAPAVSLLLNPWHVRGVVAPFQLAALASGNAFVNTEWLPTSVFVFPIVYLTILLAVLTAIRNRNALKPHLGELALLALFSVLAIRYVRNHGFFFATFPMLIAPLLPELDRRLRPVLATIAVMLLAFVAVSPPAPSLGVDSQKLPVLTTRFLVDSKLGGHIYNPDQFGGYLIHALYPARRVLTDGRNELYRPFIAEVSAAREDSRKWNALFAKYDLRLAMEDYRGEPLRVIDPASRQTTLVAPSLAYFPRQRWALIAFDDAAMLFARRDAFAADVLARMEFVALVPDDPTSIQRMSEADRNAARREVQRAEQTIGRSAILDVMKVELEPAR